MKFIKGVIQAMKDTTWLNFRQTMHSTDIVVMSSILFIIFFALVDWAAQMIIGAL